MRAQIAALSVLTVMFIAVLLLHFTGHLLGAFWLGLCTTTGCLLWVLSVITWRKG